MTATSTHPDTALDVAHQFVAIGVPVFAAEPAFNGGKWNPKGGTGGCGYLLPRGWQNTQPDPAVIERWRPGVALCAVMGHGLDLIDIDPRNGGHESWAGLADAVPGLRVYASALTPSGGLHLFIRSLNVHSVNGLLPGVDVKAGTVDGQGRGFAFIAPTCRASKNPDVAPGTIGTYQWAKPFDPDEWSEYADTDETGLLLAARIDATHATPSAVVADESAGFFDAGVWADVPGLLAKGRHDAVLKLAAELRGRENLTVDDALAIMRGRVWPLIDQAQADHPFPASEFEQTVRDAFARYPQGTRTVSVPTTQAAEQVASRRARVTWAAQIEPEPVVWAWTTGGQGRIPAGSLSVAAGREGTGKSSFGIWLAAQLTRGILPGMFEGRPRRVLYVAIEDSWKHTLVPRLIAAGADLDMVGRFDVVNDVDEQVTLSLPTDNALLESAIVEHDVGLVVLDPLMSVVSAAIDTHRNREVRTALDPLAKLADRTGTVMLGIAHFNKGGSSDPASLITGSGAFKDVPRSLFAFVKDGDNDRLMSQVKNSLGFDELPSLTYRIESAEIQTPRGLALTGRFVFTGETDKRADAVIRAEHREPEDEDDRNAVQQFVVEYLADHGGESPAGDVIKAGKPFGFNEMSLKNARRRARAPRILTRKASMGGGWVWAIDTGEDAIEGGKGAREQKPCTFATFETPSSRGDKPHDSTRRPACTACDEPLSAVIVAEGGTTHPACDIQPDAS